MTRFEEIKEMTKPEELASFLCDLVESCEDCPRDIESRCNPYAAGRFIRGFEKYLREEIEG